MTERIAKPPRSLEESVALTADMQAGMATLSDTQQRRFLLHYDHGLSYEQIARIEGCSERAVKYSVSAARELLKKFFEG